MRHIKRIVALIFALGIAFTKPTVYGKVVSDKLYYKSSFTLGGSLKRVGSLFRG